MKVKEFNKRDKAIGTLVHTTEYIYSVIYPFFQPGFCEGVIDLIKDTKYVHIIVDNNLSKNKIEAIVESDFQEEKEYIVIETAD